MQPVGTRHVTEPGSELSPGPLRYMAERTRFGGGQFGGKDSPRYSMGRKDELANSHRYISPQHSKVFMGQQGASPTAYTPLEQLGVTNMTVSNTSVHAPSFSFGSEARPCVA